MKREQRNQRPSLSKWARLAGWLVGVHIAFYFLFWLLLALFWGGPLHSVPPTWLIMRGEVLIPSSVWDGRSALKRAA